jgi:hypothetical protein
MEGYARLKECELGLQIGYSTVGRDDIHAESEVIGT